MAKIWSKDIEKIEIPKEKKFESGEIIPRTRIPLLEEAIKKINELAEEINELKRYHKTYIGGDMTIEECIKIGGHCWNKPETIATNPPVYQQICKHCKKRQVGSLNDFMMIKGEENATL